MSKNETGTSLRPSDMTAGGGLLDDADVTITNPRFVLYDFNGKSDTKVCAALTLVTDDGDEHVEFLSAADPKHFQPTDDGSRLLAVGDKTSLNQGSKFALFIASAINAGFPEADISDDINFLANVRCHVKRAAAPKSWSTMSRRGASDREPTILEVTEILEAKAAKKGAGKAPASKGAPAAKGAAPAAKGKKEAGSDIDEALMDLVVAVASEAGGTIETKALVPAVFRKWTDAGSKKAATKRVFESTFLEAGMEAGRWMFDADAASVTVLD